MNNVLIVGASSGVGLALTQSLSDSHNIWTTSSKTVPPQGTQHFTWDVTRESFPVDSLPKELDGLVYCPGSIRLQSFPQLKLGSFKEDLEINFLGAVECLQAALPALESATQASVVLFSTVAVSTGMPMHASIASAKGAIEGLTRSLAAELAPDIRVNAIAPSLTNTPLSSRLLRNDRQRQAAAERHPLGRIGEPADQAVAARFLLSDESNWITGQVLPVDGGIGAIRCFH